MCVRDSIQSKNVLTIFAPPPTITHPRHAYFYPFPPHHQCRPLPTIHSSPFSAMSDHYSDSDTSLNDELAVDAARSVDIWLSVPPDQSAYYVEQLLDSETRNVPRPDYFRLCRSRARFLTFRQDSIYYILQAHAYFNFKLETVFLAINYFDRFLSLHMLPPIGWAFRLLLIACISLAAKMEEVYPPFLLELQVLDSAYFFEDEVVQRMELLVLSKLQWNLRSVTPFDYLDHFISLLPSPASDPNSGLFHNIYGHACILIVNTTRVIDFLEFPPSVLAAAAMTIAAGDDDVDLPDTFDARISSEMVRRCEGLMDEYLLDSCQCSALSIEPLEPPSPLGVLDAAVCDDCDS